MSNWQKVEKFDDLSNFVGKMIEWDFTDGGRWSNSDIGLLVDSEPRRGEHSEYGLSWFFKAAISPEGVDRFRAISESDFQYPIRKIRVLSDEEAAKVKLSYGYPNPYANKEK